VAGVEVPRTSLDAFAIELPPGVLPGGLGPASSGAGTPSPVPSPSHEDGVERRPASLEDDLDSIPPEAVAAADADRLIAFAALDDTSLAARAARPLAPSVTVDLEGVTFRVRDREGSSEVTVGLLADVAQELRANDRDPSRPDRSRAVAQEVRAALPVDDPLASERGAVADDGCAISVRRL